MEAHYTLGVALHNLGEAVVRPTPTSQQGMTLAMPSSDSRGWGVVPMSAGAVLWILGYPDQALTGVTRPSPWRSS